MPTERLYLADPYALRFRARLVATGQRASAPTALLDRSAFYPEGGGQPADHGTLGPARVVDVQFEEGEVVHVLDRPLVAEPGAELEGAVDAARRLDFMQQHHGQHVLSAAFVRALGIHTVSCHLGDRICTVDLDASISKLDAAALRAVEAAANQAIWANLAVVARDFVGEERAALTLRKEPVKGDRVVVIEGFDASPCGGTHPTRTGDVGAIALLRAQKWGQGQARVEFVCGGRVVQALAAANEVLAAAATALGCATSEVGEAAARLGTDALARRKAVEHLTLELAKLRAGALLSKPGRAAAGPIVAQFEGGPAFARAVAVALADQGATALVATTEGGRANLCFARPRGPGPALDKLLREAAALIGGKGGGSAELAQGSGSDPSRLGEALDGASRQLEPGAAPPRPAAS